MNKKEKVAVNNLQNKKTEIENNQKSLNSITKREIEAMEQFEDVTKYGEFVSSYFAWLTLEKQKEKVEKMENITKESKN